VTLPYDDYCKLAGRREEGGRHEVPMKYPFDARKSAVDVSRLQPVGDVDPTLRPARQESAVGCVAVGWLQIRPTASCCQGSEDQFGSRAGTPVDLILPAGVRKRGLAPPDLRRSIHSRSRGSGISRRVQFARTTATGCQAVRVSRAALSSTIPTPSGTRGGIARVAGHCTADQGSCLVARQGTAAGYCGAQWKSAYPAALGESRSRAAWALLRSRGH
jgi:hypothetical protein